MKGDGDLKRGGLNKICLTLPCLWFLPFTPLPSTMGCSVLFVAAAPANGLLTGEKQVREWSTGKGSDKGRLKHLFQIILLLHHFSLFGSLIRGQFGMEVDYYVNRKEKLDDTCSFLRPLL